MPKGSYIRIRQGADLKAYVVLMGGNHEMSLPGNGHPVWYARRKAKKLSKLMGGIPIKDETKRKV